MTDQAGIAEKHSRGRSFVGVGCRTSRTRRQVARIASGCVLLAVAVTTGSCTSSTSSDLSPNPSGGAKLLNGVSALSAEDAWAVGQADLANTTEASIVHWDGTRWSRVTNPNLSSDFYTLSEVSAVSPTDVWAVGDSEYGDETLIIHWDGTRWSRVSSPKRGSVSNELSGVSAVSPTEAWAVGGAESFPGPGPYVRTTTLILHWDGKTWSQVVSPNPSPGGNFLSDVSAISATEAWAVGSDDVEGERETMILHWDGTGWSRVIGPFLGSGSYQLAGVSAVSPTNAWAVGDSRDLMTPVRETLILHWNGRRWSHAGSPNPGSALSSLNDVSAVSPTDAWAVGVYKDREAGIGHTLVLHWDGRTWSQVKSPNPGSEFAALDSVSAASPTDAWAVGYFQDKTGAHPLVLHWDGRRWSRSDVHRFQ